MVKSFFTAVKVEKIISVNDYLRPGVKKGFGKPKGYQYLSESNKHYKRNITEQLSMQLQGFEDCKKAKVKLNILFLFNPKGFAKRDVSNCIKLYEDAMVKAWGIDDSRNVSVACYKEPKNFDDHELIISWGTVEYD